MLGKGWYVRADGAEQGKRGPLGGRGAISFQSPKASERLWIRQMKERREKNIRGPFLLILPLIPLLELFMLVRKFYFYGNSRSFPSSLKAMCFLFTDQHLKCSMNCDSLFFHTLQTGSRHSKTLSLD